MLLSFFRLPSSVFLFSALQHLLIFQPSRCYIIMSANSEFNERVQKMLNQPVSVRRTFDPYSPEIVEKYGRPGKTDREGFDPYLDTVGPGIYGGVVVRDENGEIVIGEQYQNHNEEPGPVYAGGGYTPMSNALRSGKEAIEALLDKYPDLVNEISTGGATPLHMCGMSKINQMVTELLILRGGNMEAVDTYGYRPLHRMASNNLEIGAEALLKAGADPMAETSRGETPMDVARSSRAYDVVSVLLRYIDRTKS